MKQIKFEYLAPYLTYNLKWQQLWSDNHVSIDIMDAILIDDNCITFKKAPDHYMDGDNECISKPIFLPLPDLTKEQLAELGKYLIDYERHETLRIEDAESWLRGGMRPVMSLKECMETTQYLYSIHADIHGLIKQGLAIDINTLKK